MDATQRRSRRALLAIISLRSAGSPITPRGLGDTRDRWPAGLAPERRPGGLPGIAPRRRLDRSRF